MLNLRNLVLGLSLAGVSIGVSTLLSARPQGGSKTARFVHSTQCALCHDQGTGDAMRDEKRRPIAPYDLWRSSMMANSARDPFWRAAVRAEIVTSPEAERSEIEATCMRCHTPMASVSSDDTKIGLNRLEDGHPRAELAQDGVSCTVCHQITDKGFGTDASFSGHFDINEDDEIYGPHGKPFAMPMMRHTGKRPTESQHILRSEHCATCHTFVHRGSDGKTEHTEQSPYLEWRNSDFVDEQSCQDCHVPTTSVDGGPLVARIVHRPNGRDWNTAMRIPYGRHVFVGGNTVIPAILRDNAEKLDVKAPASAFDATIAAARDQLRTKTARISIGAVERKGNRLRIPVLVVNECGHKFPTGYPSRRAWLRVRVVDAEDRVVFESGAWDSEGRIIGPDGKPLASELPGGAFEAHRSEVSRAEDVQIFETIMKDENATPTWRLLAANGWAKDNRLLPRGWRATHDDAARTMPIGTATDADFVAGRDTVHYDVEAARSRGPFRIEAKLVYQTLASRYAAELFALEGSEIRDFESMWSKASKEPELVDEAKRSVSN